MGSAAMLYTRLVDTLLDLFYKVLAFKSCCLWRLGRYSIWEIMLLGQVSTTLRDYTSACQHCHMRHQPAAYLLHIVDSMFLNLGFLFFAPPYCHMCHQLADSLLLMADNMFPYLRTLFFICMMILLTKPFSYLSIIASKFSIWVLVMLGKYAEDYLGITHANYARLF